MPFEMPGGFSNIIVNGNYRLIQSEVALAYLTDIILRYEFRRNTEKSMDEKNGYSIIMYFICKHEKIMAHMAQNTEILDRLNRVLSLCEEKEKTCQPGASIEWRSSEFSWRTTQALSS